MTERACLRTPVATVTVHDVTHPAPRDVFRVTVTRVIGVLPASRMVGAVGLEFRVVAHAFAALSAEVTVRGGSRGPAYPAPCVVRGTIGTQNVTRRHAAVRVALDLAGLDEGQVGRAREVEVEWVREAFFVARDLGR